MRLYLGHHFVMGATHYVCQDYALHGDEPAPFIVVSDGCSSAPDTDVGARLLCCMARKILYHNYRVEEPQTPPLDYTDFGNKVVTTAEIITEAMGVTPDVLHATLMVACVKNNTVYVYIYGDGTILLLGHAGQVRYLDFQFNDNMPYYLNYWKNAELHTAYAQAHDTANTLEIVSGEHGEAERRHFQSPLEFKFSLEEYSAVALASDGCSQFLDTGTQVKLPLSTVAPRLLNFRTDRDAFVREHLHEVVEDYARLGVYVLDDLALGVIRVEEEV